MATVISSIEDLDFSVDELPQMPLPRNVLMVKPTYYSVEYVINPHMTKNVGHVDSIEARNEWEVIRDTYAQLEFNVQVMEGVEGLPDMVFCANQSLPYVDENQNSHAVMSIMHADQRKEEVPHLEQWYRQHGYEIHYLDEDEVSDFEGCGDALWHQGRKLLWGGYGFRSSLKAYKEVSGLLDVPIVALELTDESFYHLDTCLCILNEDTAMIYPGAFTEQGRELINRLFDHIIEATKYEAKNLFACNASCPDGKNVIIQKGCTDINKKLRDAGFSVHAVATDEYLKSGGSVFCMKQMIW